MTEASKHSLVSHELLEELLVYGYIRQNSDYSLKLKFPNDILDLCIKWYHLDSYFMFVGNKCTLDNNKTIIHYKGEDITNNSNGETIKNPNSCYHSIIMPSKSETDIEYIYTLKILECEDIICIGLDSTNGDYTDDDFTSQQSTYHYSYYSKDGTAWMKSNAVTDKRTYNNSGFGHTFGYPYGKNDIIKMHYNPYKTQYQLWFEKNAQCAQYADGYGLKIHKQMGLQYRLCIFMGDYSKQSIELINYQRIGDIDEENESELDDNIAQSYDTTDVEVAAPLMDLDTIHGELQSKLRDVSKISDLLAYIEKMNTLESLKVQISVRLHEQLTKEKTALESANSRQIIASVIGELFTIITDDSKEDDNLIDDDANNNGFRNNYSRGYDGRYGYGPPAWSTSVCYNCGEKGHFARECPAKRRYNRNRYNNNNMRCYHCGKDGHFARDCPEESNDELNEKCFRCGKLGHWARNCDVPPNDNQSGGGGGGNNSGGGGGRFSNDKCHRCGKIGHWAKDCDKPYQYQANFKQNDKCNRCGKLGHWARECDLPRNDGYNDDY